jgi:hypothetical protein
MEDEYCWTIFVDQLLAGVYMNKQKAKDHLDYLIDCFPNCVKRYESDWLIKYISDDGNVFFFMTKRKINERFFDN